MSIILDGTTGITTPDLTDSSLTSGRVVYAGTSGNLTGSSAFQFDGANVIINATTPAYFTGTSNLAQISINRSPSTGTIFNASQSAAFMNIDGASGGSSFQFATASAANTQPSERMRLDGSGNLGLGVTPSAQFSGIKSFQVGSTTNLFDNGASTKFYHNAYTAASGDETYLTTGYAQGYLMSSNGQHQWYIAASGTAGNTFSFTQPMTLDASGNLGIGTTSPTTKLTISGTSAIITTNGTTNTGARGLDFVYSGQSYGSLLNYAETGETALTAGFTSSSGYFLTFKTENVERARITNSGNLLVGTTSQIGSTASRQVIKFDNNNFYGLALGGSASGAAGMLNFYNSAGTEQGYISTTGSGSTTYSTSSDYRLKENIAPMTGALAKVAQLKPVTYTWKQDGSSGQGFIAHELQAIVPDCVTREKDAVDAEGNPKYQGVDTSFLVATLTAAIQEQQAIIESLKARLDAANL